MTEFEFRSPDGREYVVRGNGSAEIALTALMRGIVAGSVKSGGVAIGPVQPQRSQMPPSTDLRQPARRTSRMCHEATKISFCASV